MRQASITIDHGWAWMHTLATFFVYFIIFGFIKSLGTLMPIMLEAFARPEEHTFVVWVPGICMALVNLPSPFVHQAALKFGIRYSILCSALFFSLGLALVGFVVNSVATLVVCLGLLVGFGFSCAYGPSTIAVNRSFKKRLSTASGIAFSGSCVASMVAPPLFQLVTGHLGWRSAFVIYSCVALHLTILAFLYRDWPLREAPQPPPAPLDPEPSPKKLETDIEADPLRHPASSRWSESRKNSLWARFFFSEDALERKTRARLLRPAEHATPFQSRRPSRAPSITSFTQQLFGRARRLSDSLRGVLHHEHRTATVPPATSDATCPPTPLLLSSSAHNSFVDNRHHDMASSLCNSIETVTKVDEPAARTDGSGEPTSAAASGAATPAFRLVTYLLVYASYLLSNWSYLGQTFFIFLLMKQLGTSPNMQILLMPTQGVAELIGRLGVGYLLDAKKLSRQTAFLLSCAGQAVSAFGLTLGNDGMFLAYGVCYGLSGGMLLPLYSNLLVELFGIARLPSLFGFVLFGWGIASLGAYVIMSLIGRAAGSIYMVFVCCGSASTLAAAAMFCVRFVHKSPAAV